MVVLLLLLVNSSIKTVELKLTVADLISVVLIKGTPFAQ